MRGNPLIRVILTGGSLCLLMGGPVQAQAPSPQPPSMGQPGRTSMPGSNTPMSEQIPGAPTDTSRMQQKVDDKKFVRDAALGGLTEIELGKLAADKGSSDAVKQFGQKIMDDHKEANEELKKLAVAQSLGIPDSLDKKHQSRVDKLSKLTGAEFDRAYIKDQLKDRQQNVREFQDEAKYGSDAAVKDFAAKALPALQEHLAMVKKLNKEKRTSTTADRSR